MYDVCVCDFESSQTCSRFDTRAKTLPILSIEIRHYSGAARNALLPTSLNDNNNIARDYRETLSTTFPRQAVLGIIIIIIQPFCSSSTRAGIFIASDSAATTEQQRTSV